MSDRFCPCCGYDLVKDQPILLNDFAMLSPMSPLTYRGEAIKMTQAMRELCWTLMKAYPKPVRHDVIMDRIGSDGVGNVIDVYLSKIRKELRRIGAPIPFESVAPRAVVWKV